MRKCADIFARMPGGATVAALAPNPDELAKQQVVELTRLVAVLRTDVYAMVALSIFLAAAVVVLAVALRSATRGKSDGASGD